MVSKEEGALDLRLVPKVEFALDLRLASIAEAALDLRLASKVEAASVLSRFIGNSLAKEDGKWSNNVDGAILLPARAFRIATIAAAAMPSQELTDVLGCTY